MKEVYNIVTFGGMDNNLLSMLQPNLSIFAANKWILFLFSNICVNFVKKIRPFLLYC